MSEAKPFETLSPDCHVIYPASSIGVAMCAAVAANIPPNSASAAPTPAGPSWPIGVAA